MYLEKFQIDLVKNRRVEYALEPLREDKTFVAYSIPNVSMMPERVCAGDYIVATIFKGKISELENDARNLIQSVIGGYDGKFHVHQPEMLRMPVYSWNPEKDECEVGMVCLNNEALVRM